MTNDTTPVTHGEIIESTKSKMIYRNAMVALACGILVFVATLGAC